MDSVASTVGNSPEPKSVNPASTEENEEVDAAGTDTDDSSKGLSKKAKEDKRPAKKKIHTELEIQDREPVEVSLRSLLQAGVHFGHQTARWAPSMAPYIHSARNGIHIVNLPHSIAAWEIARQAIVELCSRGGNVLFVGTKKQASDAIAEEARRCGANYVSHRWLGGMITNFQTIKKSIDRLGQLENTLEQEEKNAEEGIHTRFTKKERLMMSREKEKLELSLGGIRSMGRAPQMMFVIDIRREDIAVKEAARLDIPVVALVDTNCDPRTVDYPIPSNDDGTRAIRLFCEAVADAVMEGKQKLKDRRVASATADGISTNPSFTPVESADDNAAQSVGAQPGGAQTGEAGKAVDPKAKEASLNGTAEAKPEAKKTEAESAPTKKEK